VRNLSFDSAALAVWVDTAGAFDAAGTDGAKSKDDVLTPSPAGAAGAGALEAAIVMGSELGLVAEELAADEGPGDAAPADELDRQKITNVSIAEAATASQIPTSPNRPVNLVLGARLLASVNVAVVPEAVTVPGRGVPLGPATVKVTVLSVVGFITLLKVAVITWVTGTAVAPFAGFVETTVGAMNPDCSRPHPVAKTPSTNAKNHILLTLDIRISVSSSICDMAFFSTIT